MRSMLDAITAITDAMVKIDELEEAAKVSQAAIQMQREMLDIYAEALRWIACPPMANGKHTMDRAGCEQLASNAIDRVRDVLKRVEP